MEASNVTSPMQRLDIDTDYLTAQLKALLEIPSPTGYTDSVARYVCGELERIGIEYDLTRRGAVRGCCRDVRAPGRGRSFRTSTRSAPR